MMAYPIFMMAYPIFMMGQYNFIMLTLTYLLALTYLISSYKIVSLPKNKEMYYRYLYWKYVC